MSYKKCDFSKMGYRKHVSTNKRDEKESKKIVADQKKRRKEWKAWLAGYNE